MTPDWSDDLVILHLGDCVEVMAAMPEASVDAICTDPPYGLEFMGQEWDRPWAVSAANSVGYAGRDDLALPSHRDGRNANCRACGGRARGAKRCTCEKPQWDRAPSDDMREFQAWCERWATECLRVLKPGGHLVCFGGTRTWHRLTCAVEDAGFEIRDSVADLTGIGGPGLLWLYGSGFPKSLDVSKAIDKAAGAEREVVAEGAPVRRMIPGADQNRTGSWIKDNGREFVPAVTAPATDAAARWQGWGTALKPAWEPIVVGRKPLAATVAANVLEHGTGALNVAACQVEASSRPLRIGHGQDSPGKSTYGSNGPGGGSHAAGTTDDGRWPPNVLIGPESAAELDRQSGVLTSGANPARRGSDKFRDAYGEFAGQTECVPARGADSGGASRFFPVFKYEAKAGQAERPHLADGTAHPTVKPVELMRWLVKLVTPPGGLVLDPFAGSGTTAEACVIDGFRCLLIEKDERYAELIKARLQKPIQIDLFGGAA